MSYVISEDMKHKLTLAVEVLALFLSHLICFLRESLIKGQEANCFNEKEICGNQYHQHGERFFYTQR